MTSTVTALLAAALAAMAAEPRDEAFWIRHSVHRYERLEILAERYAVTESDIRAWNDLPNDRIERGDLLRIQPEEAPPPLQYRFIRLGEARTWNEVAAHLGHDVASLQQWNPRLAKHERLPPRTRLILWLPSGVIRYPLPDFETRIQPAQVPDGGFSIGRTNRGRLDNAVQIPPSELYTIRIEHQSYGTSLAVGSLLAAIEAFRRETGFAGELKIGAMSRRTGRRLRPHRSHQSGRDVDIRLPTMEHGRSEGKLRKDEVDWFATYALIDALVRTGNVKVVFLERRFYGLLQRAAMRLGVDDARLETVMAYVSHSEGHTSHIHVRFVCSPEAERCVD